VALTVLEVNFSMVLRTEKIAENAIEIKNLTPMNSYASYELQCGYQNSVV